MATATPQLAVVNALYLNIQGLQLSNDATTPNTILDVAPGQCRDSTNSNDIYLPATKTVLGGSTLVQPPFTNLTVANPITVNTALSGAGGLDVGAIAANTMYHVYAIGSSVAQIGAGQPLSIYPGNAIISLSFTQPVLPFGYDMFRRIGTLVTDNSSHILAFTQTGNGPVRKMLYAVPIQSGISAGTATTYTSIVLNTTPTVPPLATTVYLIAQITPQAAGHELSLAPSSASSSAVYGVLSGSVAAVVQVGMVSCPCSATPQIYYKVTNAGDAADIIIAGFDDQL